MLPVKDLGQFVGGDERHAISAQRARFIRTPSLADVTNSRGSLKAAKLWLALDHHNVVNLVGETCMKLVIRTFPYGVYTCQYIPIDTGRVDLPAKSKNCPIISTKRWTAGIDLAVDPARTPSLRQE
ncbi:hypothetical protein J1614_011553 [Plenodomus biglobosus]|nr:hypothetical protein J1614_011553 [Plenodomus biglobosus]